MIRSIRYFLVVFTFFFLCSCEKELDFKYHEIEPLTVIEGVLTPDGITVRLTQTTPMGEPMNREPLTDAEVTLTDLSDDITYDLYVGNDGEYIENTGGIVGHMYRLTVSRGENIWTSESLMYPAVEIESMGISWIKMPYDYVSVLQVIYKDDIKLKGECFWLKIYRNGEIYSWAEQDDRNSANGLINFVSMLSRQDIDEEDESDILVEGDIVSIEISGISSEMKGYLEAIGNDSSGPAMFSGAKALGYFIATSPVTQSIVYKPGSIPYPK